MAEQNVVKITEEADGAKAPTARCLSELVSVTMDKAAARLSSVDTDTIFREATLKAGIRDFAQALSGHFPELRDKIPSFFNATAEEIMLGGAPGRTTVAKPRPAGGPTSAEHRKSAS